MATRLYLLNQSPESADAPTSGDKSTTLPAGTSNGTTPGEFYMGLTIGTAQASYGFTSIAQTAQQSGTYRRWSSSKLTAQTVSANTWTFFFGADESNGSANFFTSLCVYVWNPAGSSVRGFIYDNAATLGTEWATSQSAQSVTFSGSAVTASDNDYLVCEWWYNATQAMGTAYTGNFYWSGTNETTTGTGNTSVATYLETPQDLNFKLPKSNFIFIM